MKSQIDATNHLIAGISESNNKLEELVKSLYRSTNKDEADKEIESIEVIGAMEKFFETIFYAHDDGEIWDFSEFSAKELSTVEPRNFTWYEYLIELCLFVGGGNHIISSRKLFNNSRIAIRIREQDDDILSPNLERKILFEKGIKQSTAEQREQVLSALFSKADSA